MNISTNQVWLTMAERLLNESGMHSEVQMADAIEWKMGEAKRKKAADDRIGDDVELGVERAREPRSTSESFGVKAAMGGLVVGLLLGGLLGLAVTPREAV